MKKLLFIALTLVLMVCAFSITSSAYESFGTVETIDGIELSSKMGEDVITPDSANARVKLSCTCAQGSHTFPSYYVMENASSGNGYGATIAYTVFNSINEIGASCGNKSFGIGDILSYELPDGVTKVNSTVYTKDNSLKNITFLDYSTATTLKTMSMVSGYNWYNTSLQLEEIRFPDSLENISGYSFYGCTNLTTVVIPENSQIKTIGEYAFRNCTNLGGLYLPNGIESICGDDAGAFQYCDNLWLKNSPNETEKPSVYYFPETLKRLDKVVFQGCKSLSETVVFPTQITSYKGWELQGSGTVNYVFKGYITQADYVGNLTYYFVNPQNTNPNDVTSVCGWGNSVLTKVFCYADGNETHLVEKIVNEGASCTQNASNVSYCFCQTVISREDVPNSALGHDNDINNGAVIVSISYTSSDNNVTDYMSKGYKTITCARCGENNNETEADPLFTYIGIAINDDETSMCIGFSINNNAIAELNKVNGKSLEFGAVACYAGVNNEITKPLSMSEDGIVVAEDKTVIAKITGNSYNSFDFRLSGFSQDANDTYKSYGFVIGGFVFDGNDIYYLGSTCDKNATAITFNQVLNQTNR